MRKFTFISIYLILSLCISLLSSCKESSSINQSNLELNQSDPWDQLPDILNKITLPTFPDAQYNVLEYGAVKDDGKDDTDAFRKAINACTEKGGGMVVVPAGIYHSSAIHLKSNVNFHIQEGAEILFSTNPADYPMVSTAYEGIECINYSPLIYAYKQTNIAVTGKGILNGQASNENWWIWKGNKEYGWSEGMPNQKDSTSLPRLMSSQDNGIKVEDRIYGKGHYLRPTFIEPNTCEKILIQGITIKNAPFWVIHPFKSKFITVDGVTVDSHGPNNDGCNPEYSKYVLIKNSTFNTGDDCIAIKSGRDADGRRVGIKSENIVVQNCKMIDGHGGVVIGSEASSGVRNIFVENCNMDSPNLDRAIRIKTNSRRGGVIENIYVRNLEVGQVKECVLKLNMFYGIYANQSGDFVPTIRNIHLENINVKNGGEYGILAKGHPDSPITDVYLTNVTVEKVDSPYSIENVNNIHFSNTTFNGKKADDPKI
ncbi:glycoside hydrolase family 28 protein [Portibacter lacus]|uniref:Glycoside hydrolase n=1 Tax=Portibacter lacus TaxID=1099794 RepID=A0AA37WBX9_9BACT|nr:glycoside hydrolase family 28 protein [Portibacter lacus]GLR15463.1 glycoside hydrolase [Portibacter lacus]